jgi:hypothetical protein
MLCFTCRLPAHLHRPHRHHPAVAAGTLAALPPHTHQGGILSLHTPHGGRSYRECSNGADLQSRECKAMKTHMILQQECMQRLTDPTLASLPQHQCLFATLQVS